MGLVRLFLVQELNLVSRRSCHGTQRLRLILPWSEVQETSSDVFLKKNQAATRSSWELFLISTHSLQNLKVRRHRMHFRLTMFHTTQVLPIVLDQCLKWLSPRTRLETSKMSG